jgi:hypothetical protein
MNKNRKLLYIFFLSLFSSVACATTDKEKDKGDTKKEVVKSAAIAIGVQNKKESKENRQRYLFYEWPGSNAPVSYLGGDLDNEQHRYDPRIPRTQSL